MGTTPLNARMSAAGLALAIAALASCTTVDPSKHIERSAAMVAERSAWTPAWNTPWASAPVEWDATSPLSSDIAVTIALQHNRDIRARVESIARANAELVQSGLLPNPVVNLAFGFPIGGEGGGTSIAASTSQSLAWLWLRPSRTGGFKQGLEREVLGVSDAALKLIADVRSAHARVAFAQKELAVDDAQQKLLGQGVELARKRVEAGQGTALDVNRMQVREHILLHERLHHEADLTQRKVELLTLMGMSEADLGWDVLETEVVPDVPSGLNEADVIRLAAERRLDVAAALANAREKWIIARGPDGGAPLGMDLEPTYTRDDEARDELGPSVAITVPIFDTGAATNAKTASEARKASIDADAVMQRAVAQARIAFRTFESRRRQTEMHRNHLNSLAEENVRLAEQAFRAGTADTTVLLEAQRDRLETQLSLLDAELEMRLAAVELEYAVGGAVR